MIKLFVAELLHQAVELGAHALYAKVDSWKRANETAAETAARHAQEDLDFRIARGRDPNTFA